MHHIFDKVKVNIEPSVRKLTGCLGVRSRLMALGFNLSTSKGLHIVKNTLNSFCTVLSFSLSVKKGSADRVGLRVECLIHEDSFSNQREQKRIK